ncbi:hypothetical protein PHYBLDRAFT_168823 [Phycomyces blakesleeanus NRRL 1555(-)]|uniref:Uncharacterized protein n=1 Tax=Phycomyces blakesleeanus (strain ATCC 8743b / DSM 1359 / FGSC 10004 / NBRC 33097 / NRRL 1555) TaxID=763407 RepID=A0A163DUB5_PHYB8|nr:hypothetical protein PHYBLDRAFT_168823 [Phycomyces blakesleeanus NRRL 1555(-)]OAD73470.1 hypothetical protein PHYBLDRAFT_168823 [Phycomyces blakesleeanus NRRL 1555(-)]|eukprot:XP_018291510.1 hypothetical protein PHYBLDRAFT_168823 [Phycomyces blakesleeanus NRRL 1555(-)]
MALNIMTERGIVKSLWLTLTISKFSGSSRNFNYKDNFLYFIFWHNLDVAGLKRLYEWAQPLLVKFIHDNHADRYCCIVMQDFLIWSKLICYSEELLDSDIFFKRQKLCRKCQYKKTVAHGHGESVSEKNCASSLFVVTFPTKFLTFEKVRCSNLIAGEEKY